MALLAVLAILYALIIANEGSPFLLFATRKDIRLMDVESPRFNASTVVVRNLEDAAALDFFYEEEAIFWTDIGLEMIKGVHTNGSKAVDIVTSGLISPDGLACDWLGRKLYWADSETNRIEVNNLDGSYRKVLFWKDLDQPRAISLVPMEGIMFWTDWGEIPKIERAGMDGDPTTRKVIVSKDLFWPNGLTVDYEAKRVYWADAKFKLISSVDFNGNHRQAVTINKLENPFALTLYKDTLYWTDWNDKSIYSFNKQTNQQKRMVVEGYLSPMDIHVYAPERQPKVSTPCDKNNGGCSHLCLLSPKKPYYSCACPTGVKLLKDGKNCAEGPQNFLLLVRRTDLRRISLDTPDHTDVVLQLKGIRHALAIDYDPVDRQMYWTDDEVRVIRRANLDGSNQENLVTTEIGQPDGIAIDWIARNMYWTDTGTDRIEVARLNGTSRKTLIRDGLEEPRAIVVDPPAGYMYWSDWGSRPKIERAMLDGQGRVALINTSLGWPNGLAIDYIERKLYWGDAKTDKIEVANLDGTDRRVLASDQMPHIFGFTLLHDYVYWTDWQRRSIERVHKVMGSQREVIIDQLPDVMGLKAVDVNIMHEAIGTSPCAIRNGDCSHLCLNRPDGYVCSCPMGLELTPDLKTCIVPEAFLLFSRRADIRRISLESKHDDVIPVSGVEEAIALDCDISDNRIYWTDTKRKTISRAFMNGSNTEHVVQFGLEYPEGMAVDWVAHNLYWADMGLNRIEVARLDGTSRRVLLWKDLEDPRSLALDPSEGYMYWSDWGTRRIEKASMDGSQRLVLIGKIGRANGLTIDYRERRLFWTDIDMNVIESSDLQGNHRVQVISENLPNPYGLTLYQDYIYWTDWTTKSIERANKTTGGNRTVIQGQLDYVVDILVFHASRQSGWNPCAVNNGGCSHLCLALPGTNHKTFKYLCSCPTHYSLTVDNKTCSAPDNFLLFSQKNAISRILVDTSNSPDIVLPIHNLRNVKAIDYDPVDHFVYWVDGRTRTIRRSYDNGTKVSILINNPSDLFHPYDIAIDPFSRLLYWTCAQSNTINVTRLDGRAVGVVIGGDEERPRSIALHPYKGLMFWTNVVSPPRIERAAMDGLKREVLFASGLQQPGALAVDVKANLLFWTDLGFKRIETATIAGENRKVLVDSNLHQPFSVTVYEQHLYWIDQDQQVIERVNKLTGKDRQRVLGRVSQISDLIAISAIDMQYLEGHSCITNNGGCSHLCILDLNGKHQCSCPMELMLSGDKKTCISPPTCPSDHFSCLTGKTNCIPEAWRCDGSPDCEDKSDEMNCPECKPPRFRCSNGICLDPISACKDVIHCSDDISAHCCASDEFMCQSSRQCIKKSLMCNNKADCIDGSDENSSYCDGVVGHRVDDEEQKTTNYAIGIVVALTIMGLIFVVLYMCRHKSRNSDDSEEAADEMLAAKPLNPQSKNANNDHALPKATIVSTRSSSAGGGGVGGGNASACMSLPQSSSDQIYDRNHVTGASSSSSSGTPYPQETMNPPPTPVTVYSPQCMYRYRCPSYVPSSSTLASYRHYHSRNRPPPPTPCSTDVCDDSEPSIYRQRYYNSQAELSYDSDPYPPPPTPRSRCLSDDHYESCPPSPSTERSYYFHHVPPPSPVPECDT